MKDVVLPPGTSPDLSGGVREPAGFTPGPWAISPETNGQEIVAYSASPWRVRSLIVSVGAWPDNWLANATLIAAAPDLLEALELADAALSGANMNMSVLEKKVRAAIAKALGTSTAGPR